MDSTCSVCDTAIRDGDDTVTVEGHVFHAGCVEAPHDEHHRREMWMTFGVGNQMQLSEPQTTPDE